MDGYKAYDEGLIVITEQRPVINNEESKHTAIKSSHKDSNRKKELYNCS